MDDARGCYISLEDCRIIDEKASPRVIIFPEVAKQILCRTRAYLDRIVERIRKLGFEVESCVDSTASVFFLERVKSPAKIRIVPPTRERVALGLYDYPPTHRFASLHRHSMRHLSNFLLRSSGRFSDALVNALHDHYPARSNSPLHRFGMRSPILRRQREEAAEFIAHELGLY